MGDIVKRATKGGDTRFYVRYVDVDGRRKMRKAAGGLEDAKRKLRAAETRVDRGLMGVPERSDEDKKRATVTVAELADQFLKLYAPPKIKDLHMYRQQARSVFKSRIVPVLGARAAASITTIDVERLRDEELAAGLANGSVKHTLNVLSCLFKWAKRQGLVVCDNPATGCERPIEHPSLDYFDRDEVVKLLAHAEDHCPPMLHAMIAVGIFAGLRKGELGGLRWRDLALDAGRIDVNRSYRALPKSGKPRQVPLHPDLARILRRWQPKCPETDEGLVFAVEVQGGHRMVERNDMLGLPGALAAARCHYMRKPWHGLRHTFASHYVMSGGNIISLQKILGHSDITQTMVYAHLAPSYMASDMARLNFDAPALADVTPINSARH